MDTHSHLLSLGWAGPGHPLGSRRPAPHKGRSGLAYDPSCKQQTNDKGSSYGNGLINPLLVSRKANTFGIGKKTHEPAAGNDWWLKGFENALQNIGKNGSGEVAAATAYSGVNTTANGYRGKHTGLYAYFTRGQKMEGTMTETPTITLGGHKRKSDTLGSDDSNDVDSTTSSAAGLKSHKEQRFKSKATEDFERVGQFFDVRDEGRRREGRRMKMSPADEFHKIGQALDLGIDKEKTKAKASRDRGQPKTFEECAPVTSQAVRDSRSRRKPANDTPQSVERDTTGKEARRKAKKTAKAPQSTAISKEKRRSDTPRDSPSRHRPVGSPSPTPDELCKAERKKRKKLKLQSQSLAVS